MRFILLVIIIVLQIAHMKGCGLEDINEHSFKELIRQNVVEFLEVEK